MRIFIFCYGAILIVAATFIANDPTYLGNVGFLVLGAAFGSYPPFLIAEYYANRDNKRMATAIYQELANRVARCCFDFESPWKTFRTTNETMETARLKKFSPISPVIYPALSPHIAIFDNIGGQALIRFYIFLSAWEKDIETTAQEFEIRPHHTVSSRELQRLSRRLRNTLSPGLVALEEIAKSGLVKNPEEIELAAISDLDKLFPEAHPNKEKQLRERIQIALSESE